MASPSTNGNPIPYEWKRISILGKGSYGVVFLVLVNPLNQLCSPFLVAVKTANINSASSLIKEEKLYRIFGDCPEIIKCYVAKITKIPAFPGILYNLFLEYAPGGTLADLINMHRRRTNSGIPEKDVRRYTLMILRGLHCMHAKGYVHCDLKPENILSFPSLDPANNRVVYKLKIGDLGVSKDVRDGVYRDEWVWRFHGTPDYMSPESLGLGIVSDRLDVWSLGCIVVQMLSGERSPWCDFGDGLSVVEFGYLLVGGGNLVKPVIPSFVSEDGRDFLNKCFERNVFERPSVANFLTNHRFVDERLFSE